MQVREGYDSWSETYDSDKNRTRDLELIVGKSLLEKKNYENIIELGCGTGKNSEWLVNISDSLLGVDFSSKMLKQAKKKIISDKIEFIQADLLKRWEFVNRSADLITASLILEHIEDLNFIFEEAYKALSPEGLFYICELHPFKQYDGSKARFEINDQTVNLETFVHHISDYLGPAALNNFKLLQLNEWFDDVEKSGLPRLISFVFQKI